MKYIQNIFLALLIGGVIWFVIDYRKEKADRKIYQQNQTELIKSFRSELTSLTLSNDEIEDYLKTSEDQTKGLYKKLESHEKKILGRINRISNTTIKTVDTTRTEIVLDSIGRILQTIQNNTYIEIPFEDKTECFEFKAKFVFKDGTSRIDVLERRYTDTISHVSYWERRKWKLFGLIPTRFLGKKIVQLEVFNNCGFSKTIIIDKK